MTFDRERYQTRLRTRWLGLSCDHHAELDSTSAHLKRLARTAGAMPRAGHVTVADAQTAGYGQRGRSWTSEGDRGLYVSMWLPDALTALPLTVLAGVAAAEAIRMEAGHDRVGLKWVNDLVADGRKLGGILAERIMGPDGAGIVLGIGLNLSAQAVDDAVSLAELGPVPPREALLASLLNHLEGWVDLVHAVGAADLRRRWRDLAVTLGVEVRVEQAQGVLEGVAEDLTERGALVLRLRDGTRREIVSGTVRRADGRYC